MNKADEDVADQLRLLREAYEAVSKRLLDEHMERHYKNVGSPRWRHAMRCSIEVASWTAEKRRMCFAQPEVGQ